MPDGRALPQAEHLAETPDPYGAYPRLTPSRSRRSRRAARAGDRGRRGDLPGRRPSYDFVVVLQGLVAIVEHDHGVERVIAAHGAGRFLGELNLLTGETVVRFGDRARAGRDPRRAGGTAARARHEDPVFGDLLLRAFIVRRSILIGLRPG